jgi:trans-2,3-dihydro-3-hydroxyanthranilate isomerase
VHPYVIVDAFTDVPLQGNPVAVFTEGDVIPQRLMQPTARELNLSETVFVLTSEADADAQIRIFTPSTELPFAGHPVLGTAFVVAERNPDAASVRLQTGLGIVPISLTRTDGKPSFGEMEQPIPELEPFPEADLLLGALGAERSVLPVELYNNGPLQVYVALETAGQVQALEPDMTALARLGPLNISCFALTDTHVKTRMFAPGIGVPEDPATGSAAGPLALHLARHGKIGFGDQIEIHQGAEIARPSFLYARVDGSADHVERIVVGGSAVIAARGEYRLA